MRRVWLVFGVIILVAACQTTETVSPTVTPAATEVIIAQAEPTVAPTQIPTDAPTNTPVPTLPAPPTLTQAPTEIAPTDTPAPISTATPLLEPTDIPAEQPTAAVIEGNCLPAAAVADARSPFVVVDGPWPRGRAVSAEIYTGAANPKLIHIGFDVEGSPDTLPALLDILDRRQIKTTMFIVGNWAETYPDWIREFAARGHEFANHTRTHGNLGEMDYATVQDELNSTEATVVRLTGQTTKPWLRPPFGSRSDTSIQASADGGWTTIIWSGSPDDWRPELDTEAMCRTLLATSYPGGILYAHPWRPEMPEVIDRYIGTLQAQGYTFVPLSVIMSDNPGAYLLPNE